MAKAHRSSLLTIVISGIIAFVLIGGAFASLYGVQQNQDMSTQAYMGNRAPMMRTFACGATCRTDSDCGSPGKCLLPQNAVCPPGKRCSDNVKFGICRATACTNDSRCSCVSDAVLSPPTLRQAY